MNTHLLTPRQVAKRLRVSLAAVKAWQRQGLLPSVCCPFCDGASIPAEAVARAGAAA